MGKIETIEQCDCMKEQFLDVLTKKRIKTVFQPIVSLQNGTVYGYEALSRGPENTPLYNPSMLFQCAAECGKIWELEQLCRVKAIETVGELNTQINLFLNVNPQIMHNEKFKKGFTKEFLRAHNIDPKNVTFELTEKGFVNNVADFIDTVNYYKTQEYKIAIDDAGSGYSGLNMISNIYPHYIKIDINLVRNVDRDTMKQALIKSLAEFATLANTDLIAEGIETKDELLKLIDIGVQYGQGFYLRRPNEQIAPIAEDVIQTIKEANLKKNRLFDRITTDLFISDISTAQKSLTRTVLISQVYEMMDNDKTISGFCITEDGRLIGTINRSDLYRYLSGRYGYNLYATKTIDKIMNTEFLQVDAYESISTVSKKAMGRSIEHLYDFIAVIKDGKYYGIVTVKDLLEKTIQVQVNNAKHINPLSELPGNMLIENKLEKCLESSVECKILYIDINNFKAYNDVYGFENGDRVIKRLARIIETSVNGENGFIGHIGGDDFFGNCIWRR